jgi:hypothetical protein
MAFARAASVVDVRNVSCAHRPIEDLDFVYFANVICGFRERVLANKQRLVIGQATASQRGVECGRQSPVHVRVSPRSRITHNRYGDIMPISVAQVCAQLVNIQKSPVGQVDAQLSVEEE